MVFAHFHLYLSCTQPSFLTLVDQIGKQRQYDDKPAKIYLLSHYNDMTNFLIDRLTYSLLDIWTQTCKAHKHFWD